MKRLRHSSTILVLALALSFLAADWFNDSARASASKISQDSDLQKMTANLHWLGHASFRIDAEGQVIYLDPFQLTGGPKADLILISHNHSDHCSPADVAKIQKPETLIVTVAQAAEKLTGQIKLIKPGEEIIIKGITLKTIPAYNINKFRSPGVPFHPKESNYVGFILKVGGQSLYHAGDTDFIPEMQGLGVDIALLPVSGIYVMTAAEAVEAAKAIQPKLAVPMHVGGPIGSLTDAQRFRDAYPGQAVILPLEK
jgi:L-ascorbate metabolism protein UlaG (beta-lactamase superfamily)